MFKFGYPIMLWILAIVIPSLIIIYWLMIKRNIYLLSKFADKTLHTKILYGYNLSRKNIKFLFFILGLSFLLFAASDPKIGSKLKKVKYKGAEVIIALDVSKSMLAEDVYPNRLEAAKMALERLIDKLEHNRIGIIVFAGEAFVQLPITSDYVSAKMFLNTINTELIKPQGTNLSAAIELATRSFSTQDKETNKVLIIISDGEDHEGGVLEMANAASQKGIIIHTIGMGKPEGAPIPIINKFGKKDYKVDKDGNVIITKTNDVLLQQIATAANGVYVRAQNISTILKEITSRIEKLNTVENETEIYADYDHQYHYPLLLAFIFLVLEFFFIERKPNSLILKSFKNFTAIKSLFIIITLCFYPNHAKLQNYKKEIRKGTNYYLKEKYKEAEVAYSKAYKLNPQSFKSNYNLGNALYKQEKFEEAEKQFIEAPTKANNSDEQAKAYHNLGNTYLMQKKLDESIEAYKNALRRNPNDTQTKYNLSYALMLKKQQNQQSQQNQQQQQQNQQQQNQQQQNQKNQQKSEDKISKEEAERMLQALQNEEQKKQEELKKKQAIMGKKNIEKDW